MGVIGTVVTYCPRAAGPEGIVTTVPMKSTKVQNPRRVGVLRTMSMRVRGNWPRLAL